MPKLIDYPRTSYDGAWELSEIVDDTGGKCAVETAARKLDRKVSGSFKAIIGSAVKFRLLTSKRELLTTTTLFKRIKHAYDKQEELIFHREAFLTPPLFTQICRKFRSRELPVQMLDVMLIREFGVEEINAQGVAKAFVDGCRMVGLLDEHNIIADIDALNNKQAQRREPNSPQPVLKSFQQDENNTNINLSPTASRSADIKLYPTTIDNPLFENLPETSIANNPQNSNSNAFKKPVNESDAVAKLFELNRSSSTVLTPMVHIDKTQPKGIGGINLDLNDENQIRKNLTPLQTIPEQTKSPGYSAMESPNPNFQIQISGPGINTSLAITEEEDIILAMALLEKIRRQLRA
ncbi:hypothetical protein [Hymenobacter sp.]|uniref:hypothetical protein n=1 Tax=Hymenobacter sp. TaxID=1898978 RepID=UPI00286A12D0|nr:hypothetical protein [Hymenobacter sp.]